jgi:hypothetical protein
MKKAKGRKAQERADKTKVGFEKLRKKLDEMGYEAYLDYVKRKVTRVYAITHALNLEDVKLRDFEFDLVLWRVSCLFQIGSDWENIARYTCTIKYLFQLDASLSKALQENNHA